MQKFEVTPPIVCDKVAIQVNNLNYVYNAKTSFSKHALKDVNLTVNKGEFVAIVGHTGSGKSTFVQHLNALVRLQSGSMTVLGNDLSQKKLNLKQLRRDVGMVFQYPEHQLFADTVYDDVTFGPRNFGVESDKLENMARKALTLVGMDFDTVKNKSPFDLSGGEKRRVALAGVIISEPEILVMDEPTAGLDPRGKKEILSLVKNLNKELGTTVIMVSHDMNEVYENADRVLVFNEGSIVMDDTPRNLFKDENAVESINLEVPPIAQVINVMEQYGFNVPSCCRTADDLVSEIVKGGVK